ncbi:MAG: preprotein translocase subunit SecG [Bdellovibrionales bacterium]|nr:preprotein translocase subunit SecG [Bdellovibrionales bacterium]NQZ18118.1 preprotein translocase subunit SecG [Bdellovibrionales bacterium]
MVSILAFIHIALCIFLVLLVLIQDPKGGAAGGMFGGAGGSNSLLGASGATSLLSKITQWVAVVFAVSCIAMTIFIKPSSNSVLDNVAIPQKEAVETAPAADAAPAATQEAAPAAESTEAQ